MVQREISTVTSRAQTIQVARNSGTLLWILQRLTSYGLILFLGVHLYFTYFARLSATTPLTFEIFNRPFNAYTFIYALNEALLLVCALFHGLNGLRNIILDFGWVNRRAAQSFTALLVIVGLAWAYWGITAFANL